MNNKRSLFTLLLPHMEKDIEKYSLLVQLNLKYAKIFELEKCNQQQNRIDDSLKSLQNTSEIPIQKRLLNDAFYIKKSIQMPKNLLNNDAKKSYYTKYKTPSSSRITNYQSNSKHICEIKNKKYTHNNSASLFTNCPNKSGFILSYNKSNKTNYKSPLIITDIKRRTSQIVLRDCNKNNSMSTTYYNLINKYKRNYFPKCKSNYVNIKKKLNINQNKIDKERKSNTFCDSLFRSIDNASSLSLSFIKDKNEELIQNIKLDRYKNHENKNKRFENLLAIDANLIDSNDNQNDIDYLKIEYQLI